jgi:dipeptidyl aminopeptidase/acylaminoacyl peptidase
VNPTVEIRQRRSILLGVVRLFTVLLLLGTAAWAQTPAAIADPQQIVSKRKDDLQAFTPEKLLATRTIGDTAWAPDGKQVVFVSNISGRRNLWMVPAEGGWPVQLSVSEQRQTAPAWAPNGKRIAFMSDTDGNEQWDVFVVSLADGEITNLSNSPAISEENPAWSPDSRYIAWQAKPRAGSSYEIETFDMLFRRRRALTGTPPKDMSNVNPVWSPDGKRIAYTQIRADRKDANVFVVDIASGQSANLTAHEGERLYTAAAWSPDGKKLLITSDAVNGFDNVGLLDLASKQVEWLTQGKWPSQAGSFSPAGDALVWSTNVDGDQKIFLYTIATKHVEALPFTGGFDSPGGAETPFSRDGKRLLYYHNGPDVPQDIWVYDLAARHSRQITHSLIAGIRQEDMVQPALVHYPSRDGKFTISAWAFAPYNQIKNGQTPAVVLLHGGPDGQFTGAFSPPAQLLANLGYFVIAPNYRGSTGYGKEFRDANRLDMGGGDLTDVLAAADWIGKTGYVDPKKLVLLGGSYGGYLSLMAITKSPDTWAAGVAISPFVNWPTEVKNEDPLLQQYDLAMMGDPEKNQALWQDRSPLNFTDRIKAPLLLLAGGNDPRRPREEAEQLAAAVKKNGGKLEFKVYDNEGYGFARLENLVDAWRRVAGFIKLYVPAPGCGQAACEVQ